MLFNDTRVTHVRTSLEAPNILKSVKKLVLDATNEYLRIIQSNSSDLHLCVDFSIENIQHRISRFFNNNGIVGMLEATGIENEESVSLYVVAIVDLFCSIDFASLTLPVSQYVEVLRNVSLYNQVNDCTDENVLHL